MPLDEMYERERMNLLDLIRKRAENAELARIEAEESRLAATLLDQTSQPPAIPVPQKAHATDRTIREQLVHALKANRIEEAAAAFDELLVFSPDDDQLEEFKEAIAEGRRHIREKTVKAEEAHLKSKKVEQQRITQLLQSAESNYQSERYEQALKEIEQVLVLDPENADAHTRRADVEKARLLAERVRLEEEQHKSIEAAREALQDLPPRRVAVPETVDRSDSTTDEPLVQQILDEQPPGPMKQSAPKKLRSPLLWVGFVVLTVLGAAACYVVYEHLRTKVFPTRVTLLVLPSRSNSVENYLIEGLTDELIMHASHLPNVEVLSTITSLSLRTLERAEDAQSAGVNYTLRWTIEQITDDYAIRATVTNVETGQQGEQSFSIPMTKLADVSTNLVRWLATALKVDVQAFSETISKSVTSSAAFEAYLLGRYLLFHPELASLDSAASAFERARKLDREFASAEVALGWTNLLKYEGTHDTSALDLEQANSDLLRAVNLGAKTSELYTLWGAIELKRSNVAEATHRFEQAIAAAPANSEAARRLSLVYLRLGKVDQATSIARSAVRTDPRGSKSRLNFAMILLLRNDNESALREFEAELNLCSASNQTSPDPYLAALVATNQPERALDILKERVSLNPRDFVALYDLGRMLQLSGKPKLSWERILSRALTTIDDTLKVGPSFALAHSYHGLVKTRLGFFEEGLKANSRALGLDAKDVRTRYLSARIFALQKGQEPEAIRQLAQAAEQHFDLAEFLDLDFAALRENPSFAPIITHRQ